MCVFNCVCLFACAFVCLLGRVCVCLIAGGCYRCVIVCVLASS